MAIYPALTFESVVQVSDRTRLDATLSTATPNESPISLVEIRPEASAEFFDVTTDKWLDWEYATEGSKTVTVRVTTDGDPVLTTASLSVVTSADDNLLSSDAELRTFEQNVMSFLPAGRVTFKNIHRQVRDLIIDDINENGTRDKDDERVTPAAIVSVAQFRKWATFLALQIIFEGLSNEVEDIFDKKAEKYGGYASSASQAAILTLDLDGDGDDDSADESVSLSSIRAVRS